MKLEKKDFLNWVLSDKTIINAFYKDLGIPKSLEEEYLESEFLEWLKHQLKAKFMPNIENVINEIRDLRNENQKLLEQLIGLKVDTKVIFLHLLKIRKALNISAERKNPHQLKLISN